MKLRNQLTCIHDYAEEHSREGCPDRMWSSLNGTLLSRFDNKCALVVRISGRRKPHGERIRQSGLSTDARIRCETRMARSSWTAAMLWTSTFRFWIPSATTLQRCTRTWSRPVSCSRLCSSCKTVSLHLPFEFDLVSINEHSRQSGRLDGMNQKIRMFDLKFKKLGSIHPKFRSK